MHKFQQEFAFRHAGDPHIMFRTAKLRVASSSLHQETQYSYTCTLYFSTSTFRQSKNKPKSSRSISSFG